MAKNVITKTTEFSFNHSDQVEDYGKDAADFTVVQTNFDSRASETLTALNTFIDILQAANTGSYSIGHDSLSIAADNVGDALEENRSQVDGKVDKSNVLELDNTSVFNPTGDYNPSTKKYVDDQLASVVVGDVPEVGQLIKYIEPDSIVSTTISITTTGTSERLFVNITSDITGGAILINKNTNGDKPVLEQDGTPIFSLAAGYYEFVETLTSFILVSARNVLYIPISISETIKSLSDGSLDGKVSNLSWNGLTLVNSVVNGDFSDGTTGWSNLVGSSISASNNILSVTGDGSLSVVRVYSNTKNTLNQNDEMFFYGKCRVNDSVCSFIQFGMRNENGVVSVINDMGTIFTPIQNEWYELYKKSVVPSGFDGEIMSIFPNFGYSDAATANGKVMEVDGNAGVHAINMTTLGLEALTESQMLDLVRSGYIDGIQSMYRPKLKIDGKNLADETDLKPVSGRIKGSFNGDKITLDNSSDTGSRASARFRVRLKNGETYQVSVKNENIISGSGVSGVQLTEIGETLSVQAISLNTPFVFNGISGEYEIDFITDVGQIEIVEFNALIEKDNGQILGVYEPYNPSKITADVYLRGFNGESDKIYESNNQIWLDKKISDEFVFDGDESYDSYANGQGLNNNLSTIRILDFFIDNDLLELETSGYAIGYNGNFWVANDDPENFTSYGIRESGGGLRLYAPTSELPTDDLSGFITYLSNNPLTAQFKLKPQEPINLTEQGLIEGQLESRENGTVYNTSDTFGSVDVSFNVPSNITAQISSLIEANSYQQEQIDETATSVLLLNQTLLQSDWVDDTGVSGYWYIDFNNESSTVETAVDVNLDFLTVSESDLALFKGVKSFDGFFRVYAIGQPSTDVGCDIEMRVVK